MDKKTYKEMVDRVESLKNGIPHLEKNVKSKSKSKIRTSIGIMAWDLLRIYKKSANKGTSEAIQDFTNILWWYRNKKHEETLKYLPTKKQYSQWAKKYDEENNLLIVLEEKEIKDFLPKVKGKDVLDFGCGTGRYAVPLAKKGAKVVAIDFTPAMIRRAKEKAKSAKVLDKIKFQQMDIQKYKPNKKFDLIISMLVQDHIQDIGKSIDVISGASKVGTEVIISNVHPETLRVDMNKETGRAQGYLVEGYKTDQFWHPTEEYLELFKAKGFILTKVRNLIVDEKYTKMKKFSSARGIKNKALGIIMKFKKVE